MNEYQMKKTIQELKKIISLIENKLEKGVK